MYLVDKFQIIENHAQFMDKKYIITKIENFFENFINTDIKILTTDFINQGVWFNEVDKKQLIITVNEYLKNYLIQRRNNIRIFIKKNNFSFDSLNKFLKNFINKLKYISNIFKDNDNNLIKDNIKHLATLIISDSLILIFIKEQIIFLDKSIQADIELFISLIKNLSKYDNFAIYNKLLLIFSNIFVEKIIDTEELLLSDNLKRINSLNETIKYYYRVKDYFKFINKDLNKFNYQFYILIMENFINVIKYNSLDEIELVFKTIWSIINKIIIENKTEDNNIISNDFANEIINLICKSLTNYKLENLFKIINILNFCNILIHNINKEIIIQKVSNVLTTEENINYVNRDIDNIIRNLNQNKTWSYSDIIKILDFIINIKDKDNFISVYYQYLVRRLMEQIANFKLRSNDFDKFLDIEKKIVAFFTSKCGLKAVYKINKVINDANFSYYDNFDFKHKYIINDIDINFVTLTTSYNIWDINYDEGQLSQQMVDNIKHTQIGNYLQQYQKGYNYKYYDRRILTWFPHYGEISITYLNKEILMLPIQAIILEMFTDTNCIPIKEVITSPIISNYTPKFINNLINAFISSELFKIDNDKLILNTNDNFKTDLIDIFLNTSDYLNLWNEKRKEALAHSRQEIICANINHVLKTKSMNRNELFTIIQEKINIFEVTQDLFDKAIKYMFQQDYITIDKDIYEKIVYL